LERNATQVTTKKDVEKYIYLMLALCDQHCSNNM